MAGRGSVRKRGDSWTITFDVAPDPTTGKRRQRRETYRTKREAQSALTERQRERDNGTLLDPTKMSVGEYLWHWFENENAPHVLDSTAVRNERDLRLHLVPQIGAVPLAKLTGAQVAALHRALADKGLAPKTVQHAHGTLHAALDQAVRWRMLPRNPCDDARAPRVPRVEIRTWDGDLARRFVATTEGTDTTLGVLYVLAIGTGMRRGELIALTWRDVDLDRATLSVRRSRVMAGPEVVDHEPKGKRARSLDLSPQQVQMLRAHRDRQRFMREKAGDRWVDQGYVFAAPPVDKPRSFDGGRPYHPNSVTRGWSLLTARLGLPHIRLHDLRHAHATILLEMNIHLKVVQERLGHATSAQTLDTYSHVTATLGQAAVARWDAFMAPVETGDGGGEGGESFRAVTKP